MNCERGQLAIPIRGSCTALYLRLSILGGDLAAGLPGLILSSGAGPLGGEAPSVCSPATHLPRHASDAGISGTKASTKWEPDGEAWGSREASMTIPGH